MSAAFGAINHNIFLYRLSHHVDINNSVLSWFVSYLNNKSHGIVINNDISHLFQLPSGAPQVSVLAPNTVYSLNLTTSKYNL